ncbi:MAG: hypothetical protein WAU02_01900 [Candidatus Saccharimonadales bacterium]
MKITRTLLGDKRLWRPVYGRYNPDIMRRRLDGLATAGVTRSKLDASRAFADRAFAHYYQVKKSPHYGFVFAIPTRINRRNDDYISEARHFLPIVDELAPDVVQVLMSELPPVVLDEYHDRDGRAVGAVVFIPIFSDMLRDIRPRIRTKLKVNKIIKDAARFASKTLHAEIIGLGATLPKMTHFGKDFSRRGIVATTGHAGTVHLIYTEFSELVDRNFSGTVGVVGAGSISASAAAMILDAYPSARVVMYDIRPKVLRDVVAGLCRTYGRDRAVVASSNDDVLRQGQVIISAITAQLSIDESIDLTDKVIIDDSQPGSFSRKEVEARGGTLVWVVGHDHSRRKVLTRRSRFRYGDEGLCESGDVWGCEAEVASLWLMKQTHLAVDDQVTPEIVRRVGAVMDTAGVGRARWQVAGQPVTLKRKRS